MSIVIREAGVEDAEALSKLYLASWIYAYRDVIHKSFIEGDHDVLQSTEKFTKRIDRPEYKKFKIFIALEGNVILGFVEILQRDDKDDSIEVLNLYISPDRLREGIGLALFRRAFVQSSQWGFNKIYLWALKGNVLGRRFYERFGGVLSSQTRETVIDNVPYQQVQYRWDNINE